MSKRNVGAQRKLRDMPRQMSHRKHRKSGKCGHPRYLVLRLARERNAVLDEHASLRRRQQNPWLTSIRDVFRAGV